MYIVRIGLELANDFSCFVTCNAVNLNLSGTTQRCNCKANISNHIIYARVVFKAYYIYLPMNAKVYGKGMESLCKLYGNRDDGMTVDFFVGSDRRGIISIIL